MTIVTNKKRTESVLAIPVNGVEIEAELRIPPNAQGVVIFVHGSGSSRHSPRNKFVAERLRAAGCGTLLMDYNPAKSQ